MNAAQLEDRCIPEPNSGCWLWLKSVESRGYGKTYHEGRTMLAHRASWLVFKGAIPAGLNVLHKCDVPGCINPAHLKLGTHQDNTDDRVLKGRRCETSMPGETNPAARLSPAQVVQIFRSTKSESQLAREYGVAESTIGRIRRGQQWASLTLKLAEYEEPWA